MPRRTDANQPAIVKALRQIGASVTDTHGVGHGYPDIAVGWRGATYLLEIKTADGRLTADEREWHADWRGQVAIVRTIEDALRAIGAIAEQKKGWEWE